MKDKNGKTVLAKFARPIEYKAAFPGSPRGAWQKDCDAVNRVAEELRKRDIPLRIVCISGKKYREYLDERMISDSPEVREEFAAITAATRKYNFTEAARAARRLGGLTGGKSRPKKREDDLLYDPPEREKWFTRKQEKIQFLDVEKIVDRVARYACENFRGAVWIHSEGSSDIEDYFHYIRLNAKTDFEVMADCDEDKLVEFYCEKICGEPLKGG